MTILEVVKLLTKVTRWSLCLSITQGVLEVTRRSNLVEVLLASIVIVSSSLCLALSISAS